jgi:hypothetical protein
MKDALKFSKSHTSPLSKTSSNEKDIEIFSSSTPTRPAKVVWTRLTYIHGFLLGLVYHRYLAVKVARGVLLLVLHTAPLPCS